MRLPNGSGAGSRRVRGAGAVALTLTLLATGASGCDSLAEAQQGIGHGELVNELSDRLGAAERLTYSADYQLPGGAGATIARAQRPARAAYIYPGGRLIVTDTATTECRGSSCTVTAPPSPSTDPDASLFADPGRHGLVPPGVVAGLLTAAGLDTDAVIRQHDTTVAGQHATCVEITAVENAPASAFSTCVTTSGVLGSFTGVVNGSEIDVALIRYQDTVDSGAFDPPAGASVTDRRPR